MKNKKLLFTIISFILVVIFLIITIIFLIKGNQKLSGMFLSFALFSSFPVGAIRFIKSFED